MALEIKFSDDIPTDDRKKTAVSDITGDYDASTNPTGYGTPNLLRSDFAFMAIAYDMNSDTSKEIDLEDYDPTSVSIFTLPISNDGYYKLNIYTVPIADYNLSVPTNDILLESDYDVTVKQIKFVENANSQLEKLFKQITDIRRQDGQEADVRELVQCREIIHNQLVAANYEFCDANYENAKLIIKSVNEVINNL